MQPIRKILVAIDIETRGGIALERAVQLAHRFQAMLVVADVIPELTWAQRMLLSESQALQTLIVRDRAIRLRRLVRTLRSQGVDAHPKILVGRSGEQLIRLVLRGKFDFLVRATKGPHSRRQQFFSGTAFELLRNCPCPIWLCEPAEEGGHEKGHASPAAEPGETIAPEVTDAGRAEIARAAARTTGLEHVSRAEPRVLVAIDPAAEGPGLSELNEELLRAGELITSLLGGSMHVLHAWSIQGEGLVKDYMQTSDFRVLEEAIQKRSWELLQELIRSVGVQVPPERLHLVRGEASREISRFVQEQGVHTLVMGTLGRSGLAGLLMGNTAEMLLHRVRCSVVALKPSGFVSRVKLRPRSVASTNLASVKTGG